MGEVVQDMRQTRPATQAAGVVGRTSVGSLAQALNASPRVVALDRLGETLSRRAPFQPLPVVQRVNALGSIEQPAGEDDKAASDEVPDLTKELVLQITNAKKAAERRDALTALMNYLKGKIDVPDAVQWKYIHRNNENLATTLAIPKHGEQTLEPDGPIEITVYKGAFDQGPAVLYSTLRHELIHAAQRAMAPDAEEDGGASVDDGFIHEDIENKLNVKNSENGGKTAEIKRLQVTMQEIETYSWEIVHHEETGISNEYYDTTVAGLKDFTADLDEIVSGIIDDAASGDPVAKRLWRFWRGYIVKSFITQNAAFKALLARNRLDEEGAEEIQSLVLLNQGMISKLS